MKVHESLFKQSHFLRGLTASISRMDVYISNIPPRAAPDPVWNMFSGLEKVRARAGCWLLCVCFLLSLLPLKGCFLCAGNLALLRMSNNGTGGPHFLPPRLPVWGRHLHVPLSHLPTPLLEPSWEAPCAAGLCLPPQSPRPEPFRQTEQLRSPLPEADTPAPRSD